MSKPNVLEEGNWKCEILRDEIHVQRRMPYAIWKINTLQPNSICKKCGHPLLPEENCRWCSMDPKLDAIDQVYPLGAYNPKLRSDFKDLISGVKKDPNYAIPLGLGIALIAYNVYPELLSSKYVIPIPQNEENSRGFNQSLLIAEVFSKKTNIPLLDIMIEKKDISLQGLRRRERFRIVKDNYELKADVPFDNNGSVILIDDVLTSGATANECAAVLKSKVNNVNFHVNVLIPGRDVQHYEKGMI